MNVDTAHPRQRRNRLERRHHRSARPTVKVRIWACRGGRRVSYVHAVGDFVGVPPLGGLGIPNPPKGGTPTRSGPEGANLTTRIGLVGCGKWGRLAPADLADPRAEGAS